MSAVHKKLRYRLRSSWIHGARTYAISDCMARKWLTSTHVIKDSETVAIKDNSEYS